jgi:hypothetical protein
MFCDNPSHERWAKYRAIVGITGRRRTLTSYEALMLWALRHWRTVCREIGEPFILPGTVLDMEPIVNVWLRKSTQSLGLTALTQITTLNNVQGRDFSNLVQVLLGKSISERSLYRIGQMLGVPSFSITKRYTKNQVQKYLKVIALES